MVDSGWWIADERAHGTKPEVLTRLVMSCEGDPVLGTAAVAIGEDFAGLACLWKRISLREAEGEHARIEREASDAPLPDVPDEVLRIDEVVAGVEAAIPLEDRRFAAGLAVDAEGVRQAIGGTQGLVEGLHHHSPHSIGDPQVEDAAEEIAYRLGRRR